METVVAKQLVGYAKHFGLLLAMHFSGHTGCTTTDAVLFLCQHIKDTWRAHCIASALFLEISQAFPIVSHEQLSHILCKHHIPKDLVAWVASFLASWTTSFSFNNFASDPIAAPTGIPQRSPLSLILYLFFASDLLKIVNNSDAWQQLVIGFINDTALLVSSSTM